MKKQNKILASLCVLMLAACSSSQSSNDIKTSSNTKSKVLGADEQVIIPLQAKSGSQVSGTIEVYALKEGTVLLQLKAKNVPPGLHAIHVHENPDCSSADGSSAGGHWNPTQDKHGRWGHKNGYHKGDIGVFLADKEGNVDYTFKTTTDSWCIGCNDPAKNILGHSIILHSDPDDFVTQPTGNAGGRIACGVIR
ncbi:superoxide dismutase family protein [Neisseriaceae bacterium PsAf]|nr:superoxide dismutase family protein [Neisseriaceae bacterium PsAf]MCV2502670.1 superoxide dismutase family protein [Neisseriaceae bacterium]